MFTTTSGLLQSKFPLLIGWEGANHFAFLTYTWLGPVTCLPHPPFPGLMALEDLGKEEVEAEALERLWIP